MTRIKITTDRQPWAAGMPRELGAEIDVPADEAEVLIANGFAEAIGDAVVAEDAPTTRRRRTEAAQ